MNNSLSNMVSCILIVFSSLIYGQQKIVYVSPNVGVENEATTNDGTTLNSPLKTIKNALSKFESTDSGTIFLLEGVYQEDNLTISNKNNISIRPYEGASVVFDGTVTIDSEWIEHDAANHIWKTPVDEDVWQLFVNGEEKIMARWPNTSFENDHIYKKENWAHGYVETDDTSNGDLVKGNKELNGYIQIDNNQDVTDLQTINPNGALLIGNIGSFRTYVCDITSNVMNPSDAEEGIVLKKPYFTHTPILAKNWRDKHHYYFIEGKLNLLDATNEWFFQKEGTQRYVYAIDTNNGNNLNNATVKGKRQSFALEIKNATNISIEGFKFFATTLRINNGENIFIKNNTFSFPNCSKRMLGGDVSKHFQLVTSVDYFIDETTPLNSKLKNMGSKNCVFENNVFEYTDGEALILAGNEHIVTNNYFHHIDYSCANIQGIGNSIYAIGNDHKFTYNTVHTTGASETLVFGGKSIITHNDISKTGLGQSDGAVVQITKNNVEGSETAYNWIHDISKYAIRFDAVIGESEKAGKNGLVHHNVFWNSGGMMIKGNSQEIYNNTAFDNFKNDIIILKEFYTENGVEKFTNSLTHTRNNAVDVLSSHRSKNEAIPGTSSNNSKDISVRNLLTKTDIVYNNSLVLSNRDLYDFRPINDSELVDTGIEIATTVFSSIEKDITANAVNSPDRGAYEYDGNKWIPGVSDDFDTATYPWQWPSSTASYNQGLQELTVLKLYPQPVSKGVDVKISYPGTISKISVFNTYGKLLHIQSGDHKTIATDKLKQGAYIIQLLTEKNTVINKQLLIL
ncbi:MAG: T9SS type A sorting domain-containing protein [Flavicella sp.]